MKLDIPVPQISNVDTYDKDVPATYEVPRSYIRYCRPSAEQLEYKIDYNLDLEDELWLQNQPRFGTKINGEKGKKDEEDKIKNKKEKMAVNNKSKSNKNSKRSLSKSNSSSLNTDSQIDDSNSTDVDSQDEGGNTENVTKPTLSLSIFEHMLDILEKATEFETIITLSQAERLILGKIPSLLQTFKSSGSGGPTVNCERKRKKNPTTVRIVISDVYNYWIQKRSKLKKPLLRKYWPVTASNDTNPHLVFRPREKEKYKLRKKRQNDYDAYKKMKQLRIDYAKIRVLLELIHKREELNKCILDMQCDWFDKRIYDMVDTSGLPKQSDRLSHEQIEKALQIPKHFDTRSLERGKKKKRKKSSSGKGQRPSPVPPQINNENAGLDQPPPIDNAKALPLKVVADQEHPPLFLHPLETRESYVTSWDNAVPFVTSYVDSHPTPTFRFRHRPRIGRGGRVIIDRLPRPGNPDMPPANIFISGDEARLRGSKDPHTSLIDLLPEPLNHDRLSRRIEEIAADALSDDEDNAIQSRSSILPGTSDTTGLDENDGEEVLVKMSDWMDTDEQLWGEELCCAIGPV